MTRITPNLSSIAAPTCLLLFLQFLPLATFASDTDIAQALPVKSDALSKEDSIRDIDRQIALELVELDRFNIRYRLGVNRTAAWRKVAYPLAQEGNAAGLMGYTLTGLRQTVRGWNKPALISKSALQNGLASATVGTILGGASSAWELLADGVQHQREKRQGFSPKLAVSFEKNKVSHIDQLLKVRDDLMADSAIAGNRRELVTLKGQMLRYIRDRLVSEFEQWNIHAREYSRYRNTFYAINIMANFTRFAAIQLSSKGLNSPGYQGAVGPTLISAGFIAALAPAMSSVSGILMRKHQTKLLARQFGNSNTESNEEMDQHYQRLSQLLAETGELDERNKTLLADIALLRKNSLGLDETIHRESGKIRELRRVAAQHAVVGPIVGTLSLASGTLNTIGYYAYRQKPKVVNRLGLPAELLSLNGESLALYVTPKSAISGFLYERNLRKKGLHPEQLLAKRLLDLDELEQAIKQPL